MAQPPEDDPLLDALNTLETAVEQSAARNQLLLRRIRYVRGRGRLGDQSYREILEGQPGPNIVKLASEGVEEMSSALNYVRRTMAVTLHDEGMPMPQIAALFGVTRQRISAVLRDRGT